MRRRPRLAVRAIVSALALALTLALPVRPANAEDVSPRARPVPAPIDVSITDAGFSPASFTLTVNQTVRFTNDTGQVHTVSADDGTFDSGPIPSGGAYAMAIGAPGSFLFRSVGNAQHVGLAVVSLLDLPGDPGTPIAGGGLPLIKIPPVLDFDDHPTLAVVASRTRAVVAFADTATVADANAALAEAGVSVIGTVPGLGTVVVQAADDGPGQFGPIDTAVEVLRRNPAVEAAFHDRLMGTDVIPRQPEDAMQSAPREWAWDDARLGGSGAPTVPTGTGGNAGLEAGRFPGAWNLLDVTRQRGSPAQTVVYDGGFERQPDLPDAGVELCYAVVVGCTANTSEADHGTHVAGTIGALWDNLSESNPTRSLGVSGGNPVARLSVVGWGGSFPRPERDALQRNTPGAATGGTYALWSAILEQKRAGGKFPDLRVMNYSATSVQFSVEAGFLAWPRIWAGRTCGPGVGDDASGTGPCTPNTEDGFLREVAFEGALMRKVARYASQKNVLIAAAAGNYSGRMCESATNVSNPNGATSESQGATCPTGSTFTKLDTRRVYAFGWAETNWNTADELPILTVGSVDRANERSKFSHVNADVSATGTDVLSTVPTNVDPSGYALYSGTSMATPHVSALAGYLVAYEPSLSVGQVRDVIVKSARGDTNESVGPRIDAYAALLRLPNGARDMADLNDPSLDGNRRIVRSQGGAETADEVTGNQIDGAQLQSSPDGRVDMRDFRRFRDAWLQWCVIGGNPAFTNCPTQSAISLDGDARHPKKDLNQDRCVMLAAGDCQATEQNFSRFDLNGDGFLDPLRTAPIGFGNDTSESLSDLGMLQRSFETSGGWVKEDLPALLRSGDLEVRADALFAAGAGKVDVSVKYGPDGKMITGTIDQRGGAGIITVPTDDAASQIEVVGRADVNGTTVESALELTSLKYGDDKRVDLCVPRVELQAADPALWSGGGDSTAVNATFLRCDGKPVEAERVAFRVEREDGTPATSTLSAPAGTTDKSGRATVDLTAGAADEKVVVLAEITVEGVPGTPPQVVTAKTNVAVDRGPRLIYRWEQYTDSWNLRDRYSDAQGQIVTDYRGTAPVVAERRGALTPYPGGDDGRSGVFVDEAVNEGTIDYEWTNDLGGSGTGTKRVPACCDEVRRAQLTDNLVADYYNPDGSPKDPQVLANTWLDITDDRVVANNLADISAVGYEYTEGPSDTDCRVGTLTCDPLYSFNQLGFDEREVGSAFAYADDLTKPVSFQRKPDGTWSTYQWCSARAAYPFPPHDVVSPDWRNDGEAWSKFRVIATITTDPNMTADDLQLPPSDCTDNPLPPTAAIARDFVTAREGQVVRFVDASSDPNNDV
ncbi:MAG: S8 family serine peptidase, partial [Actinobacteria bacterium]|nr:S8 family serine peptidase [Actinomycetota bacterium]